MPRTIKTTLELGGESAYKKGLQSVDRALKAMSKELAEATSKFAENSASLKNVSSVSNAYKNSIEQQKVKVESLKGAVETCNKKYEEAVKKYEEAAAANGENSAETLKAADALYKAESALDGYKAKLASAEKYLESSQKKMKEFTDENKNIIALSESVEKVKDKISSLSTVQNVTKKFEELKTKAGGIAEKLEPVTSKIKKVESAISPVKGAFELAAKKAGAIKEKLEPAINVCKNVAKEAAKISFKAAETGAKAVSTSIDTAKKAFTAYTGAIAASGLAIGKWAVNTGKEFDSQMSTVASISGATGDELEALTEKAKEMGRTTSFSATESAQALEYMAMAGWKTQDMTNGLAGVINLAAASGEELATVSDIVTDAMTAFGMSASESTYFADVLAKTASSANTNVSMMGETFKYVAPVAGALNVSVEDTAEAIGLMANAGIKSSQAGTTLRSILTRLSTDAGASSKSLGALGTLTEELGVEFYDSEGKVRDFGTILSESREQWKTLSAEDSATFAKKIAGQEGISGWLALMNAAPADIEKLSTAIKNCDGAAKKMSETRLDNLQGDITLLKSNAEGVALSLSEKLNPALRFLVKAASGVITAFSQRGIGGALTQISTIIPKIVSGISGQLPPMITSFISGFNGVITSVVGAIVQALPTLINDILPPLITGFQSLVSSLIAYLPEVIPLLLDGFFTLFSSLIDSVNLVIEQLMPMLPDIITKISAALIENLPTLLDGALKLFLGLIQSLNKVIEQLMPMLPQLITDLCDTLIANIDEIISAGFDLLIGLIDGITECIPTLLEKAPEIIDKLVNSLTEDDKLQKLIQAGFDLVVALAEGLPKACFKIVAKVPEIVSAIWDTIKETDWAQLGIDILRGIADGLIAGVDAIGSKIESAGEAIKNKFKDFFGIASPSKLFKKEVGVYLAQGIGVGFEDEMDKVTKQMQKAVPSDFSTVVNADVNSFAARPSTSTVTKNSNMTVNYIFENVTINNDKDIEENAYQLEFMRRKAALAMGGI